MHAEDLFRLLISASSIILRPQLMKYTRRAGTLAAAVYFSDAKSCRQSISLDRPSLSLLYYRTTRLQRTQVFCYLLLTHGCSSFFKTNYTCMRDNLVGKFAIFYENAYGIASETAKDR